jgi:hypothetical protein
LCLPCPSCIRDVPNSDLGRCTDALLSHLRRISGQFTEIGHDFLLLYASSIIRVIK